MTNKLTLEVGVGGGEVSGEELSGYWIVLVVLDQWVGLGSPRIGVLGSSGNGCLFQIGQI